MTLQTVQVTSGIVAQIPSVPNDWDQFIGDVPDKDEPPAADEAGDLGTLGESPEGEKLRTFMRSR